jgi:hypothetical protein
VRFLRRASDATADVELQFRAAAERTMRGRIWSAPDDRVVRDVLDFVLTGQPTAVLVGGNRGGSWHGGDEQPVDGGRELYGMVDDIPAGIWLRWARWLEADKSCFGGSNSFGGLQAGGWVDQLLTDIGRVFPRGTIPIRVASLAELLELDGTSLAALLDAAFRSATRPSYLVPTHDARSALRRLEGYSSAVADHAGQLVLRFSGGSVDDRVEALSMASTLDERALTLIAPGLAEAATASATAVRDKAQALVYPHADLVAPALREVAGGGKPEQRAIALDLLWGWAAPGPDGDGQRAFARETAEADRAASVRALLGGWEAGADSASADGLPDVPLPDLEWAAPDTPALRTLVERIALALEVGREQARQYNAWVSRGGHASGTHLHMRSAPDLRPRRADVETLTNLLRTDGPLPDDVERPRANVNYHEVAQYVVESRAHPGTALKVLDWFGYVRQGRYAQAVMTPVLEGLHAVTGRPSLLELQALVDAMGEDGASIVWRWYARDWQALARDWPPDDVWPFVADNLDLVLAPLPRDDFGVDHLAQFRAVATLPQLPTRVRDHLFSLALGNAKAVRAAAQDALDGDDGRVPRAAAALGDGKGEVRAAAATWLGRIGDPAAVEPLEKAVAKEKQDLPKAAMLDALEALGQPVEKYLDRDRLSADAAKAVAKGLPKPLDWLAWERLPADRWADSGRAVEPATIQWLAATAVKSRSPEPNAILRRYCGLMGPERADLAVALLDSWIAEDTRPIPAEEAEARARQMALGVHQSLSYHPGLAHPLAGLSVDQLLAHYLPDHLGQPAGSATDSKGLLAVVAACADGRVVAPAERYLKQWYGQRPSQGKALIAMLAWVDDARATQLVLSIGSRFRTKSFQEEATRQAEALAERHGWTVDELADRTIPTAGFDESGRLVLDYGARSFTARVQPDASIVLTDEAGRPVKALPAPRQSDDTELAKAAKKTLAQAKKDLKSVVSLQTDRLYEALCTERTWPAPDWERYLAQHPVVRHLAQRLVWVHEAPQDGPSGSRGSGDDVVFRLMDDGSLTDADDEPVVLDPAARVRLAHDSNLSDEQVARWVAHLADYEVVPLFHQLGKGTFDLPEDRRAATSLDDVKGHVLEAFALRGRATRLGWTRGPAEDGGVFMTYLKRFPTLALEARLGFTGNALPEENRTVALLELTYVRTDPRGGEAALPLGEVPAILLSETWNDARLIAADGTGFDPDWERTTQW